MKLFRGVFWITHESLSQISYLQSFSSPNLKLSFSILKDIRVSFKLLISSTLTNLCCFFVTEVRRLCVNKEGWSPRSIVQTSLFFYNQKTDSCGTVLKSNAMKEERQKLHFIYFWYHNL